MPGYFRLQLLSVLPYRPEVDGLVVEEVSMALATAWRYLMGAEEPAFLTEVQCMVCRAAESRALADRFEFSS